MCCRMAVVRNRLVEGAQQGALYMQVGSRGVKALNPTKTPMSMDAILEVSLLKFPSSLLT